MTFFTVFAGVFGLSKNVGSMESTIADLFEHWLLLSYSRLGDAPHCDSRICTYHISNL